MQAARGGPALRTVKALLEGTGVHLRRQLRVHADLKELLKDKEVFSGRLEHMLLVLQSCYGCHSLTAYSDKLNIRSSVDTFYRICMTEGE